MHSNAAHQVPYRFAFTQVQPRPDLYPQLTNRFTNRAGALNTPRRTIKGRQKTVPSFPMETMLKVKEKI